MECCWELQVCHIITPYQWLVLQCRSWLSPGFFYSSSEYLVIEKSSFTDEPIGQVLFEQHILFARWYDRGWGYAVDLKTALFTEAKIWKQCRCPSMDGWIKKMDFILYMQWMLFIHKKWNLVISNNMDGPMLSEIS